MTLSPIVIRLIRCVWGPVFAGCRPEGGYESVSPPLTYRRTSELINVPPTGTLREMNTSIDVSAMGRIGVRWLEG